MEDLLDRILGPLRAGVKRCVGVDVQHSGLGTTTHPSHVSARVGGSWYSITQAYIHAYRQANLSSFYKRTYSIIIVWPISYWVNFRTITWITPGQHYTPPPHQTIRKKNRLMGGGGWIQNTNNKQKENYFLGNYYLQNSHSLLLFQPIHQWKWSEILARAYYADIRALCNSA